MEIIDAINELRIKRNAIIMAHNYQPAEIQDIADFVGDSLELAIKATQVKHDVIVFCGVHFMAESAAMMSPDKIVLLPDQEAGCPMADMITGDQLRTLKAQHPGAKVLCYINSSAAVKAESDICVTSANAVKIVNSLPTDQPIIFVPDRHLGLYAAEQTGRELILWPGFCPTHARFTETQVQQARRASPGCKVLAHPECPKPVRDNADAVLSTGGMCDYIKEHGKGTYVIATEAGILHRLRKENPESTFLPLQEGAVCPNMKKITLEKVKWSLEDLTPQIVVPEQVAVLARRSVEAMFALS